jgi:hypothetical protein
VTAVKRAPLANYRIVYFATHGLVAGDVKGVAELSLAKAREVAQPKLNADWVRLSAPTMTEISVIAGPFQ